MATASEVSDKPVDDVQVEQSFIPWRVFVNQIDSYHGKKLAEFIPEQFYNSGEDGDDSALEEEEEEEEEPAGHRDESVSGKVGSSKKENEMVRKYEVVGTMMNKENPIPEDVSMIINHGNDRVSFLHELMKCGVIVYDITQDFSQVAEAQWALEAITDELRKMASDKPKAFKRGEEVRHFVLISTVMTWASSKPLYDDDPELPFTEADYRKRRPHANFKQHSRCEKDVVMVKKLDELKGKLKTIVLCCGVTYGDEEGPFHHLFKMGWLNEPELPIFGDGNNEIPLLHVRNIPKIVLMFLRDWPKLRYVVAVEHVRMSQKTIVKMISRTLTTGRVKILAPEEAFLMNDITQQSYDMITLNLNIEPGYLADENIDWHTLLPFDENVIDIVDEYKAARNLQPVKIVVLGPPASGKTRLAKILGEHYRINYVHVKPLIAETIIKLTEDIEAARNSHSIQTDEDNDEQETYDVESLLEELEEIRRNLSENQDRLDDEVLRKIIGKKLMSKECQNQGYVLDGYPKTLQQAKNLFGDRDEPDEEEQLENKIMPEAVIVLEASDEFLTERLLNLSEAEIQGTHYTEEHVIRRFREYRERNTDDNTPLQFFDELEVHPVFINVEDDPCPDMFTSFNICLKKIGRPRNYGLTAEEIADIQKRAKAEEDAAVMAENERRMIEELNRKKQREKKMMEWTNLIEKLKEEEENQLCIMGEPLRHYLVKYVFPTLTQGLVNVAELRPQDPVDYLAEYLFKENPEGKMFEPDYTETMSMLLAAIEELQKDILPLDEVENGAERYLKQDRKSGTREEETDEAPDCPYQSSTKSECNKLWGSAGSFEGEMQ